MPDGKLSLNVARVEDLLAAGIDLPSAHDILGYRDTHGRFWGWAQVEGVPSVDYRLLRVLKEHFALDEQEPPPAFL